MYQLRDLIIDHNEFGGNLNGILDCGNCTQTMRTFRSIDNPLRTGTIPETISEFTSLSQFHIVQSLVEGTIPTRIGSLLDLADLDLSFNTFFATETTLPIELSNLSKLSRFVFTNSYVFGQIPAEYGNMESLKEFRVNGTFLTGTVPESVCQIGGLETIVHSSSDGNCGLWLFGKHLQHS
jgi:hypothetical protein